MTRDIYSCFANQLMVFLLGMVVTGVANSQERQEAYDSVRGWSVSYYNDNRGFLGCDAQIANRGQYLRVGFDGINNTWAIGIRTNRRGEIAGNLEIDGRNAQVTFTHFPDGWAMVQLITQEIADLKSGSNVSVNTGGGYFDFSLSGSTAAMLKVQECVQYQGRQPQRRVAQKQQNQPAPRTSAPTHNCRAGEQLLPVSGLCTDKARRLLRITSGSGDMHLEPGCSSAVNETELMGGEVLLYKASRCNGQTAKLKFSAGAKFAKLSGPGLEMVGAYRDGKDVANAVLTRARSVMESQDNKSKCYTQSGREYGHPDDSFVVNDVDYNQYNIDAAKGPGEGGGLCGKWGVFSDSLSYWRALSEDVWFFDFGQDVQQFDGGSFTVIAKDAQGDWGAVD